ncbi:Gfo/Idh/MocA family protein [Streptomonospora algeriensis]|uniref:Gfo/Idh/MocA family protein n=1 Tax=Streptomonospora algeriensis TaxID=995084 RepID=A0ABW3BBJ4_9ACTN
MSADVRLGVLGCADIAWRRMLPAAERTPGVCVTAVAGRDQRRTARFAERFSAAAVHDYGELLQRSDIDAVYIALPNSLHHEWACRAVQSGRHVLVEKPMTCCYRHTVELIAQARANRRVLMENVTAQRHTQHEEVELLVAEGRIGTLRSFSAHFGIPPLPAGNIRYRSDLGGGVLLDLGIYTLRAAMRFAGPRLALRGAVLRTDPATGVDMSGAALLASSEGVDAHLSFGFDHDYACGYTLWGSQGSIRAERAVSVPADTRPVLTVSRKGESETVLAAACDQDSVTLAEFADQTRGRGAAAAHQVATLRSARLLDAVRTAARTGAAPLHRRQP